MPTSSEMSVVVRRVPFGGNSVLYLFASNFGFIVRYENPTILLKFKFVDPAGIVHGNVYLSASSL